MTMAVAEVASLVGMAMVAAVASLPTAGTSTLAAMRPALKACAAG